MKLRSATDGNFRYRRRSGAMRHAMLVPLYALLLACAGAPQRDPVPLDALDRAELDGFAAVRSWGHRFSPHFQADLVQSIRDEPHDPDDMRRLFDIEFDIAVAGDRWKNGPPGFE